MQTHGTSSLAHRWNEKQSQIQLGGPYKCPVSITVRSAANIKPVIPTQTLLLLLQTSSAGSQRRKGQGLDSNCHLAQAAHGFLAQTCTRATRKHTRVLNEAIISKSSQQLLPPSNVRPFKEKEKEGSGRLSVLHIKTVKP